MPGNSAVKSTAKVSLQRFWPRAIVTVLVFASVLVVGVFVNQIHSLVFGKNSVVFTVVFNIAYFLSLTSPLCLGIIRWYWRATAGQVDPLGELFCYFASLRDFLRSVKFSVMFLARVMLAAVAAMLPYLLIHIASLNKIFDFFGISVRTWSVYLWVLENLFFVLGIAAVIIFTVRFYLAPVLFVACDKMSPSETLYMSKIVSRESTGPFVIFLIGFFGWALLTLLGVTALYTLPYFCAAYAVHCRYAINHYNHNAEIGEQMIFPQYRSSF